MTDQITKILIRKGTLAQKDAIILDEAELGYTVDQKRVFIGDGVTAGGIIIGNIYFGEINLDVSIASLQYATFGDTVYDTSDNTFLSLTGTDNQQKNNYIRLSGKYPGTVTSLSIGSGLVSSTTNPITGSGAIEIAPDITKLNPLTVSSNGVLVDLNILYPIDTVIMTATNINPVAAGGILENSGQDWDTAGSITTSLTVVYAWTRTG